MRKMEPPLEQMIDTDGEYSLTVHAGGCARGA